MRSSFAKLLMLQAPRAVAATRAASRAAATAATAANSTNTASEPLAMAPLDVGWHESSYELMRGVDVIEFDASEAPLIMASMDDL
jgi:hypothetical protein